MSPAPNFPLRPSLKIISIIERAKASLERRISRLKGGDMKTAMQTQLVRVTQAHDDAVAALESYIAEKFPKADDPSPDAPNAPDAP